MTASTSPWKNPRIVGLVIGSILVLALIAALSLSFISFGTSSYTADFARSGGLKAGDEVRIAGVGVGKVKKVELKGDHVEVTFTVDDDVHLGADTRAEVKLATLLGNKYIQLAPEGLGDLEDNRIPLAHTHVTFDVQEALEAGGTALGELDANKIQRALRTVSNAYRHTPPGVRASLDGLGEVSRQLGSRRDQLEALVAGASDVVTVLQSRSKDIVSLMSSSDLLMREIVARRQAIDNLITGTRSLAVQLSGLVSDHAAGIQPFLDRLVAVTDLLDERSEEIDKALKVIGPAARYYVNATGNGPFADVQVPYVSPDNALCRTRAISDCR